MRSFLACCSCCSCLDFAKRSLNEETGRIVSSLARATGARCTLEGLIVPSRARFRDTSCALGAALRPSRARAGETGSRSCRRSRVGDTGTSMSGRRNRGWDMGACNDFVGERLELSVRAEELRAVFESGLFFFPLSLFSFNFISICCSFNCSVSSSSSSTPSSSSSSSAIATSCSAFELLMGRLNGEGDGDLSWSRRLSSSHRFFPVGEAMRASKGERGGHAVRFLSGEILARGDSRTTTMLSDAPLFGRGHSNAMRGVMACST